MKVSREESLTQPFVLGSEDLTKFNSRIGSVISNLKFEVTCRDHLKREFSTLEELLRFENPPRADIQTLRILGFSPDAETKLWMKFDRDMTRNIFVSLEGDEESAFALNEAIEDSLSMIKPWYSILARPESWLVFWALWTLVFGAISLTDVMAGRVQFSNIAVWKIVLVIGFLFVTGMVFQVLFTKLRLAVFPMGVFAIGQGLKRHKNRELVRTGVVVAFAISLVSSLFASLALGLRG